MIKHMRYIVTVFMMWLYGVYDMIDGAYSHLTLWTWNLHCVAWMVNIFTNHSPFIIRRANKMLSIMSFVGHGVY